MHLDKLFITVPPAKKKGYGSRVGVKKGLELLLEQLNEVQRLSTGSFVRPHNEFI